MFEILALIDDIEDPWVRRSWAQTYLDILRLNNG